MVTPCNHVLQMLPSGMCARGLAHYLCTVNAAPWQRVSNPLILYCYETHLSITITVIGIIATGRLVTFVAVISIIATAIGNIITAIGIPGTDIGYTRFP